MATQTKIIGIDGEVIKASGEVLAELEATQAEMRAFEEGLIAKREARANAINELRALGLSEVAIAALTGAAN